MQLILKLHKELAPIDLSNYQERYVFSLKTQQLYTALEDLFKQIAKAFENHIDSFLSYDKELLSRMNTEVPGIRPIIIQNSCYLFLDKIRAFRHFIRHAYDCELDEQELKKIQMMINDQFPLLTNDLAAFREYIVSLTA